MNERKVSVFLSIVSFLHLLILPVGAGLVREMMKATWDHSTVFSLMTVTAVLLTALILVYVKVSNSKFKKLK